MNDFLKVNRNGRILEIVLDRLKANALDASSCRKMGRVFADFRDDPDLRAAILTGTGEKFFRGGWDLSPLPPAKTISMISEKVDSAVSLR